MRSLSYLSGIPKNLPRHLVAATCAYEAYAIWSHRAPTISALCWQHRILVPIIVSGLLAHFMYPPEILEVLGELDTISEAA